MGGGGGGNNAAVVPSAMAGASALVVAPDSPDATEGREVEPSFYSSVANAIKQSNGLRSVFCVVPGDEATEGGSDEGEGGGGGLLGGLQLGPGSWASVKAAAASKGVKCYTLKHGRIFGGVPGAEPLPFQGGPMKEPVLDEHYVARAVMLSRSDALLNLNNANPLGKNMQVRTSRAALSETIYRVLLANKCESLPPAHLESYSLTSPASPASPASPPRPLCPSTADPCAPSPPPRSQPATPRRSRRPSRC